MLKIVLIGDLHYFASTDDNAPLLNDRDSFFDNYVRTILDNGADLYISIGDLTHMGLAEEFESLQQYFDDAGATFRSVLGNHDVLSMPKSELLTVTGQPRYGAMETDEALLVFLDTTKEAELHGWGLDAEQWDWLREQIPRSMDKPILVFGHHPVPETTSGSPGGERPFMPYQDMRPLLRERGGPGFYFNGHTHTHSVVHQGQWRFIQTAAAFCRPCFRLIELDGHQVRIRTIDAGGDSLLRSAKALHDRLKGFHRPGGEIDEQTDLEIDIREEFD
ncbi:hypothetical protein FE784_25875 [Paenibacillus hemerocallicola]|uniref:Calcineurin-like phosphoesterase domain-containing protein n=1 Tax=Paenibacillus hemerocallicola TaxID=1172614 RepID=A0A5C4T2R6_9BACL|nr:metallophosphoesterase [Paenibacillus hemerocallicola]TNJ63351.1 hypothetical protein FE784_25875 [Paenibacillus hemerocallicola]